MILYLIISVIFWSKIDHVYGEWNKDINKNAWHVHEKALATYMVYSKTIHIRILESKDRPTRETTDLATVLLKNIPENKLTNIEKIVVRPGILDNVHSSKVMIKYDGSEQIDAVSSEENFAKLQLFSDPTDLFIYLAWNEEVFLHFLANPKVAVPKSRALYIMIFMYRDTNGCDDFLERTVQLLVHLWEKHSMLNVVVNAPCTCHPEHFYTFDPFTRVAKTIWGAVIVRRAEQVLKKNNLVTNKLRNFNRIPLKVSLFERIPTLLLDEVQKNPCVREVAQKEPRGMYGLDSEVLKSLSDYLNFEIQIDMDEVSFGNILDNGTGTGSIGKVMRKEVEWAANSRFMEGSHYDKVEYTVSIANEEMCVVVPKSLRVPHSIALFRCFQTDVQASILAITLLSIIFWYFYKKTSDARSRHDPSRAWLEVFAMMISVPVGVPARTRSFFFFTGLMLFNVVVAAVFQGNLVKSFSNIDYFEELNSLDDFLSSRMKIHTSFLGLFAGYNSSTFQGLQEAIVDSSVTNNSSMMLAAVSRATAALQRRADADFFISNCFTDPSGVPLLHVMDECARKFLLGYPLRKDSPFIPMFNNVLKKLLQGGFFDHWRKQTLDTLTRYSKRPQLGEDGTFRKLQLSDILVAFYVLLGGYLSSCAAFVAERYFRSS